MADDLRCSQFARDVGLDPVGSVGSYREFLLVEIPLPWPRDVGEHALVSGLADALRRAEAAGRSVRVQAVLPPNGDMDPSRRRVVHLMQLPGEWAAPYCRAEVAGRADEIDALCRAALACEIPRSAYEHRSAVSDLLICTHGRRDRCCGSLGPKLLNVDSDALGDIRVWRTSHTGGHRFAPTGLTFPDGIGWAYLDADSLAAVVRRDGSPEDVVANHRGAAALPHPAAQALDREGLVRFGWDWTSWQRRATWRATDGGGSFDVRIAYRGTGGEGTVSGRVDVTRQVPIPDCGRAVTGQEKTQPELRVSELEVAPATR